jgi:hypothetical protein
MRTYSLITGGRKGSAEVKIFYVDGKPFLAFGYSGLEQEFDHVQTGSACRHVVWYFKKIAACSTAYSKFDGSVVVEFLFDNRIVVNDVSKAVAGNNGESDRDNGAGKDETGDLFGFGGDPMDAIRS